MSTDSTLRAIAALACIYTIGVFVAVTSNAALNGVAHEPGAICVERTCAAGAQRHAPPADDFAYSRAIHTAALFLAGE
jgi:hypothetical protein